MAVGPSCRIELPVVERCHIGLQIYGIPWRTEGGGRRRRSETIGPPPPILVIMNELTRFAWPLGLLAAFVGLFVGVGSTDRFAYDVRAVELGGHRLEVQFGEAVTGMPLESLRLPAGSRLLKDEAYGDHARQKLDVYIPPGVAPGVAPGIAPGIAPEEGEEPGAPVVFMVHGGGWQRGDKSARDTVRNKVNWLLPKGYVVVSVNYRLSPEIVPTAQAADVAAALAYVQGNASRWGADPARIVLMGHSAGAHLVTMLTSAPDIAAAAGVQPWLGTVSLDSAAYNVVELMATRHRSVYDRAFGRDPSFWAEASPALRLQETPPPMLLVCSTLWANSCRQAASYARAIEAVGGTVHRLSVVMSHNAVNRTVGVPGRLTNAVADFFRSLGLP